MVRNFRHYVKLKTEKTNFFKLLFQFRRHLKVSYETTESELKSLSRKFADRAVGSQEHFCGT